MWLFILPITANLISFSRVKIEPVSVWKSRGTKTAAKKLILINEHMGGEEPSAGSTERGEMPSPWVSDVSFPGLIPSCIKELGSGGTVATASPHAGVLLAGADPWFECNAVRKDGDGSCHLG